MEGDAVIFGKLTVTHNADGVQIAVGEPHDFRAQDLPREIVAELAATLLEDLAGTAVPADRSRLSETAWWLRDTWRPEGGAA